MGGRGERGRWPNACVRIKCKSKFQEQTCGYDLDKTPSPFKGKERSLQERSLPVAGTTGHVKGRTKINSKRIQDLNVRDKTRKLGEENIGLHFHDLWLGKDFLEMTSNV